MTKATPKQPQRTKEKPRVSFNIFETNLENQQIHSIVEPSAQRESISNGRKGREKS
jgi:hypothetical protein